MKTLPYRPGVGVMLLNDRGQVFVGQRLDSTLEAWQMPQGGIDAGEDPRAAAYRELEEETGVPAALAVIVAESDGWLDYDLPEDLIGKLWKGKYRGQRQKWFAMRFKGTDADVKLDAHQAEFRAWKWAEPAELPALIVPFKRDLYTKVLDAFAHVLPGLESQMTEDTDKNEAPKPPRTWSKTQVGTGVAIGVGSAAIAAALLYAGRQYRKPAPAPKK